MANDAMIKLMASIAIADQNGDPDIDKLQALASLSDDLRQNLEKKGGPTITKLPDIVNLDVLDKMRATLGCNVCPFCGNKKTLWDACKDGSMDGVDEFEYEDYLSFKLFKDGKFFVRGHWEYWVHYECNKCGAAWNSKRYTKGKTRKDHPYL